MTKLELAKKENKPGKFPTKTDFAKFLVKKYPTEFDSVEKARSIVRVLTKSLGQKLRDTPNLTSDDWKHFDFPDGDKNDFSKVILTTKRNLILSDIHIPYHNTPALKAAFNYAKTYKPDCILLNGDIIDCYQLSEFDKDPSKPKFMHELKLLDQFTSELKRMFPNAKIVYKLGNHEERYESKILRKVPELVELDYFNFENIIKAKERGIQVVKNKRLIKIAGLNVGHGHEFSKGFVAPVNPARGFYLKAKSNFLGGHHHQISQHDEPDINGNINAAFSTGCLCDLNPYYMPINKWQHGFATVTVEDGTFNVDLKKIINGKVI